MMEFINFFDKLSLKYKTGGPVFRIVWNKQKLFEEATYGVK